VLYPTINQRQSVQAVEIEQQAGNMKEIDAHFDAYEHLKHLPREGEALHMLRKAASMVKPMMRKRGWKVRTLAEFLPDEPQLLGMFCEIYAKSLLM
jgi:cupin superfamily acireductone dioxygenase involved in methionine salvage